MIESYTLRMRGGKEGGGKGALVQKELAGTLGAVNDQTLIVCFRVLPEDSNAMKSKNPTSGFYETEIAPCIDTTEQSPAKKQGGMAVVVYESHCQDGRYNECKRVTPTLDAHMGTGGGNVPMVIDDKGDLYGDAKKADSRKVLPLLRKETGEKEISERRLRVPVSLQSKEVLQSGVYGEGVRDERENEEPLLDDGALSRTKGVSAKAMSDLRRCDKTNGGASQKWQLEGQQSNKFNEVVQKLPHENPSRNALVRRLTPRETERLQGFPDDWTAIPWRGKDAEHCPDAPRYRAIGNSWCVPVIRWLGRRIEEGLERCQQQKK